MMFPENSQTTWIDNVVPRRLREEASTIVNQLESVTSDVARLCRRSTGVMCSLDEHVTRAYAEVDRLVTDASVEQEVQESVRLFLSHVAGTARLHRAIDALEHVLADVVRASTPASNPVDLDDTPVQSHTSEPPPDGRGDVAIRF